MWCTQAVYRMNFQSDESLNVGGVRREYHHGLIGTRSAWALKYPAARRKRTCLKCYARRLCVLRRTSKLANKPAGVKEGRFKPTITDVGNIYGVRPGGEPCCEISLNLVFKFAAIHSLTSTLYPYTQTPNSIHILVTLAASSPKLGKDFLTLTPL